MIDSQEQIFQSVELWIFSIKEIRIGFTMYCTQISAQYCIYIICSEHNTTQLYNANCNKFIMMTSMLKWMQCKHNQTKIPKK